MTKVYAIVPVLLTTVISDDNSYLCFTACPIDKRDVGVGVVSVVLVLRSLALTNTLITRRAS